MEFRALFVGINIYGGYTMEPLLGCENDVTRMRELVEGRYRVPSSNIRTLLDDQATTEAIVGGIRWLAERDGPGPRTCLFHYSGHGSFVADKSKDESDGRDEGICPYEYDGHNLLIDDQLRKLYDGFDRDTHLVLIMDSCNSGTVQKDPEKKITYRFAEPPRDEFRAARVAERAAKARRDEFVEAFVRDSVKELKPMVAQATEAELGDVARKLVRRARARYDRKTYGYDAARGNMVLIAACRADQESADYEDFPEGPHGALTYFLLQALSDGGSLTYHDLVERLSENMLNYDSDEMIFKQVPQLECTRSLQSHPFLGVTP